MIKTNRKKAKSLVLALVVTSAMLFPSLLPAPVSAQGSGEYRADALILTNTSSGSYLDFVHYIQPYLDHFGIAYTVLDIASTAVTAGIVDYALIVIGHNELDPDSLYLDSAEQTLISTAVAEGAGLVNFDSVLAAGGLMPRYQYVQDVFQFSYVASTAGNSVEIHSDAGPPGDYIVAAQPVGAGYTLDGGIAPVGVVPPTEAATLATINGQPFLVATTQGQGRAVQWTTYAWLDNDVWGYVRGFDDLVWRSLVWAARKPFVMQGLPPLLPFRIDDCAGPFWWAEDAVTYGFKPWMGFFLDDLDTEDTIQLKALIDSGDATASVHAFTDGNFFYYNHDGGDFTDTEIAAHFAEATQWHQEKEIPISKYVLPHYYEIGTNAFDGLEAWGVEFIGTQQEIGTWYFGSPWLMIGPYRNYVSGDADSDLPVHYADYVTVPGHPEHDDKFFNVITEIRDVAGYEWYPDADVSGSIERGVDQLKRAFDSMTLATLFTHEYFLLSISREEWVAILAGVVDGVSSYSPRYVTMDYAAQYVRAVHTSSVASSVYDPVREMLDTTLSGSTDLPTQFYLFFEHDGTIQQVFVDVPIFSDSIVVSIPTSPTAVGVYGLGTGPDQRHPVLVWLAPLALLILAAFTVMAAHQSRPSHAPIRSDRR